MEICSECVTKLRMSYQFQVRVLNGQVIWKLKGRRGTDVGLSQRVGNGNKSGIIKKEIDVDEDHKEILCPQSSIDQESQLKQPSEIACQQDTKNVFAGSSADEGNSSFNLEDYLVVNDRSKSEKVKHKAGKDKHLCCNICCKKFDKVLELERHKTKKHGLRAIACPHCPQRYGRFRELRAHLALLHKDKARFTCGRCGEKNFYMSEHVLHTKSHRLALGQKRERVPFLCAVCGKTFPDSGGKARHMKIHMGIKPFKCAVCNKEFNQKHHLETHTRIHTGEKPYICEICGQAFAFRASIDSHIRSKHVNGDGLSHKPKKSVKSKSVLQSRGSEESKSRSLPTFYSEEFYRMFS